MRLREIPGALALGLLASLAAHTALYGSEHAMGGAYNELLLQIAVMSSAGFAAFLGALAWMGAQGVADGSILAARLRVYVPSLASTAGAAGLWFVLGERIEMRHSSPGAWLTCACLLLAAWLLLGLTRRLVRLLAGTIVTIARSSFAARTPVWIRFAKPLPIVRRRPLLRRRFARPPPIANARA